MNKEKLKQIIIDLKNKYHENWLNIREEVMKTLEDVKNIIKTTDPMDSNTFVEIRNIVSKRLKDLLGGQDIFWIYLTGQPDEVEIQNHLNYIFNNKKCRDLLLKAESSSTNNLDEIMSSLEGILSDIHGSNINISVLSAWLCVFNPKLFMPVNSVVLRDDLLHVLGSSRFWGGHADVGKFANFIKDVNEVAQELSLDNLVEVAYYLNKYEGGEIVEYESTHSDEDPIKKWEKLKELVKEFIEWCTIDKNKQDIKRRISMKKVYSKIFSEDLLKKASEGDVNAQDEIINGIIEYQPYSSYDLKKYFNAWRNGNECFKTLYKLILKAEEGKVEEVENIMDQIANRVPGLAIYTTSVILTYRCPTKYFTKNATSHNALKALIGDSFENFSYSDFCKNIELIKNVFCRTLRTLLRDENLVEEFDASIKQFLEDCDNVCFDTFLWFVKKEYYDKNRTIGLSINDIENISKLLEKTSRQRQKTSRQNPCAIILYGPPGTGKTWEAINFVRNTLGLPYDHENYKESVIEKILPLRNVEAYEKDPLKNYKELLYEVITFHKSYSYEDFVEGIRPFVDEDKIVYEVFDGPLKKMTYIAIATAILSYKDYSNPEYLNTLKKDAENLLEKIDKLRRSDPKHLYENYKDYKKKALELIRKMRELQNKDRNNVKKIFENAPYVYLIIDEINRADISRVFGELITLIEDDKRIGQNNEVWVTLQYSKEPFCLPPNLIIIGTMNSADRSIAIVDFALRRRFHFIDIYPKLKVIDNDELKEFLKALNEEVTKRKGFDYAIGHAYFIKVAKGEESIANVLRNKIIPLLIEYFYNDPGRLQEILGKEFVAENSQSSTPQNAIIVINSKEGVIKELRLDKIKDDVAEKIIKHVILKEKSVGEQKPPQETQGESSPEESSE